MRNPRQEQASDHAAADPAEGAHGGGHEGGDAEVECLSCSGYGEQSESDGVDGHQYWWRDFGDRLVAEEDGEGGQAGGGSVAPVVDSGGWHVADEDIADDAAAETGDEGDEDEPEEIEVLLGGGDGALEGEYEDSGKIERG